MQMISKLMGLYLFNLVGLVGMVCVIRRTGHTFPEALGTIRDTIILQLRGGHPKSTGIVVILAQTWWMMVFMTLYLWIREPDRVYGYLVIGLGLIHLGGYWGSLPSGALEMERIETLDSGWGIIHLTVGENSVFNSRSLAELDLRKKNLLILAIIRDQKMVPFPKGVEVLMPGDRLVIFGDLGYYQGIKS